MNCADLEILLTDYVDSTLRGEQKSAVEQHLAECAACGELVRDARAAVEFMERAAAVDAPPELVTRILFELQAGSSRQTVKPSLFRRLFGATVGRWLEPVLQPRFAMGMAMTVLSFAMLGRFSGIQVRQLKPSDLDPVKVWMTIDDRARRTWERGVKYYENLRWVYEIQSRLKEWSDQADAEKKADPKNTPPAASGPATPTGTQKAPSDAAERGKQ